MNRGRGFAAALLAPRFALALWVALGFAGCGGNPPAPIEDRGARGSVDQAGRYTVARGDTLYSIAFRFGLDFRRLAAGNGIPPPYTIYPGQVLDLRASPPASRSAPAPKAATAGKASTPKAAPVPRSVPVKSAEPRVTTPGVAEQKQAVVKQAEVKQAEAKVSSWRWPAAGRVVRRFSTIVHKGIDIAGGQGDPVRASAAGRVVYAGAGIAGYGQLLIVRHNERYLSAYGHNERLLVGEGESVAAGQRIATRGSSGTDRVKLHFEIRRDGKPVDPLSLLPKR